MRHLKALAIVCLCGAASLVSVGVALVVHASKRAARILHRGRAARIRE